MLLLVIGIGTYFSFSNFSELNTLEKGDSLVLASFKNEKVIAAEVEQVLNSQGVSSVSTISQNHVTNIIDEIIRGKVMHKEALRLKLDQDPEVQAAIQQLLNQKLLQKTIIEPVMNRTISEAELKTYFDQHKWDYSRPQQIRVADIFIQLPENATSEERVVKRAKAEEILKEAIKQESERFGFGSLVNIHSDKHKLYPLGDTGFFGHNGQPNGVPIEVATAAFTLKNNGELFKEIIETSEGFHIIKRVGYKAAIERNFKDLKPLLTQRIRNEELARKKIAFINNLKTRQKVKIESENLTTFLNKYELKSSSENIMLTTNGDQHSGPPPLPR